MPLDSAPARGLEPETLSDAGGGGAWAVVQTHPQAEHWACFNLQRTGYPTYLPLVRVRRRDPVVRTVTRLVDVPLFAGYAFVQPGTNWWPITRSTPGVARLLLVDGKPGHLRCGFVEDLRASEDARRSLADPATWQPGAACRIASGAFSGHSAVIAAIARDTARVGVIVFGAVREVSVPLDALEPR